MVDPPIQLLVRGKRPRSGVSFRGKGDTIMNQTEIGKFIAECRKEKHLTQAQLAEKLSITDRAVSKWETGKSMPDSSIMLALCEILGITVNELLSGERIGTETYEKKADENLVALKRKGEHDLTKNTLASILFSAALLIGMMVCLICDMAISGSVTWALIPVSSIAFAWVVPFPGILWGKRGGLISLLSFSVFAIPYLFLLSRLLNVKEVFSIGAAAGPAIVFLWIIAAVFAGVGKKRKLTAFGITFLLASLFVLAVNVTLSSLIGGPVLEIWDMLAILILLILACGCFIFDCAGKKGAAGG